MNSEYISIIVPVLNEFDQLEKLINSLKELSFFENEIIIVDGGSEDGSVEWLKNNKGYTYIQTNKGKAHQQNEGARIAKSPILYFLHADTLPPNNFDKLILNTVSQSKKVGSFRLKFSDSHWALNFAAFSSKYNNRFCRGGDQSLFILKELFDELKGFNENYLICEDGELIDRIYKQTSFCVLPYDVLTSARRFKENGVLRLQFHFTIIHIMRVIGMAPERLYSYYSKFVK